MKNKSQLIIWGGGLSIQKGITLGLKDKLKGKYVFTLNYSCEHFKDATAEVFVDDVFYNQSDKTATKLKTPLSSLPLILGQMKKDIIEVFPNSILKKSINTYSPRDISKGIYKSQLCGLWAITTALYLLDEGDEILLLGYDNGSLNKEIMNKQWITHYYQGEIKHRGVGKNGYYNGKTQAERDYGVYAGETKIKIWNVSPDSKIPTFEKINYEEFFKKLDNKTYDQELLRTQIKRRMK